MSELLPFLVAGLTSGAVYGMAGLGLVLTYKTSGVFNFAHGALATISAYTFYVLHVEHGLSWPVAAVISVLGLGVVMGYFLELLARTVQQAGLALQVATTVGLLIAIESSIQLIFGNTETRQVPVFLGSGSVTIGGTIVQWSDIATLIIAVVATLLLWAFFRFSRRGLEMRAVVDDPELAATIGTGPVTTRRWAWVIGSIIVSASGVLFAPLLALDPLQLSLLVVAAFGAAALGAFSNMPMTLIGGLGIGVLASFSTKWFTTGVLAGVPPSVPFLVLFIVLIVFPRRYLAARAYTAPRTRTAWAPPLRAQLSGGALLIAFFAIVPTFAGLHLSAWSYSLGTMIVFLSLALLVRSSGQVSLCHVSFVAIGAVAFSHLAVGAHLPWLLALIVAGLIAVPVGALLAIPAIRLSGLYLALATFGFGICLQYMFYGADFMFGENGISLRMPRPAVSWLNVHSDKGFYYLTLVVTAVIALAVAALSRNRIGRSMRGMADSPTALRTNGANVNMTRVIIFCLSAFLAAVGGALAGMSQGTIAFQSYDSFQSLVYFVLIIIVLGGEVWAAVLASVSLVVIPSYITTGTVTYVLQLIFGVSALLTSVVPPSMLGVPPAVQRWVDRLFGGHRAEVPAGVEAAVPVQPERVAPGTLAVSDLRVRFGGLTAVDGISFEAPTGRITGLIGPNGAGKTTTFNACSGLNRPTSGTISLDDRTISRWSPAARARAGLGRTFQKVELFDSLSVWDNVLVGREASYSGLNPLSHFVGLRRTTKQAQRAAADAIALCEIGDIAHTSVSALSTGQRRLVELARCLAGDYRILLLDEPSSGLDRAETERFGEILQNVVAQRGVGILLVEHDMSLVLDVCEHIYVLDFGALLFAGTPQAIANSPVVRAAYLGDEAAEASVVGA